MIVASVPSADPADRCRVPVLTRSAKIGLACLVKHIDFLDSLPIWVGPDDYTATVNISRAESASGLILQVRLAKGEDWEWSTSA